MSSIISFLVATIVSSAAAFFGVFLVLFTDVLNIGQRLLSYLYILFIYGILSLLLSLSWPARGKLWVWWLLVPAGVVTAFVMYQEPGTTLVDLGAAVAAGLGVFIGYRLAHRRRILKK